MKIEGNYCTKTTLLHHRYRLDQFNYEQTLHKFATSAFSTKSAQCQKKNKNACDYAQRRHCKNILQCYEQTDTILKIQLNMGRSGSSGQKEHVCHSCKEALKKITKKNSQSP